MTGFFRIALARISAERMKRYRESGKREPSQNPSKLLKSNQAGLRTPHRNGRVENTESDRPQIHVAPKEAGNSLQAQFLFNKLSLICDTNRADIVPGY